MRIYLAGGHICGKYQQYKDYEKMKIYLAGQNGAHSIIPAVHRGGKDMIVFLAGGVSGNLKPAWQKVAKQSDISLKTFKKELINENFWQGGSLGIGFKMQLRRRKKMI